jgi:Zn-dependent membrane protease YugP
MVAVSASVDSENLRRDQSPVHIPGVFASWRGVWFERSANKLGILRNQVTAVVGKVLNAAAMTYVTAMVGAGLSLLHPTLIARGNDRD